MPADRPLVKIAGLLIPAERAEEFEHLRMNFRTELQPRGAVQEDMFDHIVFSAWNLRHLARWESAICETIASNGGERSVQALQRELETVYRLRTHRENMLHSSIKLLKSIQDEEIKSALKLHSIRQKQNFKTNPNRRTPGKVTIQ